MFTKPLTRQSISTLDTSKDSDSITRLLVAAAVNPRFCATLLANPQHAVKSGFGGEGFPLSRPYVRSAGIDPCFDVARVRASVK